MLQKRLNNLLDTFVVPSDKKGDLLWLQNNVAVKNSGHRNLPEVQALVVELLNLKNKKRVETFLKNN